jgi:hypothetical protein
LKTRPLAVPPSTVVEISIEGAPSGTYRVEAVVVAVHIA